MSSIELATALGHHPGKSAQNGPNHEQHEDNARGKTKADSVNASAASDTGRLLTALASHNRRRVRQKRTQQRSEE
jgi:hypothetical protein